MGNTNKPARKQFEDFHFEADDSFLNDRVSESHRFSKNKCISSDFEDRQKEVVKDHTSRLESEVKEVLVSGCREFNVLPADFLAKSSSFQEIFQKKSQKEQCESISHPSLSSSKELFRALVFVENTMSFLLPHADFMEESTDSFLFKTHCFLGTKSHVKKPYESKKEISHVVKTVDRVFHELNESHYADEEFLRQLKGIEQVNEPVSPLNLSQEGDDQNDFQEDKPDREETPLNRTQLFANYFYEEGNGEEQDLLSPIKPTKATQKVPVKGYESGRLDIPLKTLQSKTQSIDHSIHVIDQSSARQDNPQAFSYKHKYFNKNPFDKLFNDLTNIPDLERGEVPKGSETSFKTSGETTAYKHQSWNLASNKENKLPSCKSPAGNMKKNEKQSGAKVITVDLRESGVSQKRESVIRDSKGSKQGKGYRDLHSRDASHRQLPSKENKKTVATSKGQKKPPLVEQIAPKEHGSALVVDKTSQEKSSFGFANKHRPHITQREHLEEHPQEPQRNSLLEFLNVEVQTAHTREPFNDRMTIEINQQTQYQQRLTREEETYLRSQYFAGRQSNFPQHKAHKPRNGDGDPVNGPSESKNEMVTLMQSYQLDSGQKPSGGRSLESDGPNKKFSVNIHKLSQQAMLELQDLDQ